MLFRYISLPECPGAWGWGWGCKTATEAKRSGAKRPGGQNEISGKNGLERNDSDFRRHCSNVFYSLQNQFKALITKSI